MVRVGLAGIVVVAVLAAVPGGAFARGGEAPSRAEFVKAADEICAVPYRKALRLIFKADVLADAGSHRRGGKKLVKAGKLTLGVNDRLRRLTPPVADAQLIEAWLKGTREGFEQLTKAGRALKRERPGASDRLLKRSQKTTRRANKKVAALGFSHCA